MSPTAPPTQSPSASPTILWTKSGRGYAVGAALFAACVLFCAFFGGFLAPLHWKGTNVAEAVVVGLVLLVPGLWLLRLTWRLATMRVVASAQGVDIFGPRHDHHLAWSDIHAFAAGSAPGVSMARDSMPVVVAELTDGRRPITIHALRVDGSGAQTAAKARVAEFCEQLNSFRPRASAAGPA